jgi:hypothetical protein
MCWSEQWPESEQGQPSQCHSLLLELLQLLQLCAMLIFQVAFLRPVVPTTMPTHAWVKGMYEITPLISIWCFMSSVSFGFFFGAKPKATHKSQTSVQSCSKERQGRDQMIACIFSVVCKEQL